MVSAKLFDFQQRDLGTNWKPVCSHSKMVTIRKRMQYQRPNAEMAEKKSPYRADAAAALRAEIENCAKSTHLDLHDDSFADLRTVTRPVIAPAHFPNDPFVKT